MPFGHLLLFCVILSLAWYGHGIRYAFFVTTHGTWNGVHVVWTRS